MGGEVRLGGGRGFRKSFDFTVRQCVEPWNDLFLNNSVEVVDGRGHGGLGALGGNLLHNCQPLRGLLLPLRRRRSVRRFASAISRVVCITGLDTRGGRPPKESWGNCATTAAALLPSISDERRREVAAGG